MSIITESRVFLKRLISCQSFSIIRPWLDPNKVTKSSDACSQPCDPSYGVAVNVLDSESCT